MTTAFSPCLKRTQWKTLYRIAILETNKCVLPQRVSEAEEAVKARERELFYDNGSREEGNGTSEEKEALDDALYALRAFRSAWQNTEAA